MILSVPAGIMGSVNIVCKLAAFGYIIADAEVE